MFIAHFHAHIHYSQTPPEDSELNERNTNVKLGNVISVRKIRPVQSYLKRQCAMPERRRQCSCLRIHLAGRLDGLTTRLYRFTQLNTCDLNDEC